jgi:hypothetical protein
MLRLRANAATHLAVLLPLRRSQSPSCPLATRQVDTGLRIGLQQFLDYGQPGPILGQLFAALGANLQRTSDVFDLAVFVVEETQFFCPFLCAGKPMMKEATALATMRSMLSGGFT